VVPWRSNQVFSGVRFKISRVVAIIGVMAGVLLLVYAVHMMYRAPADLPFVDRLVYIPAGSCVVGSREGRPDEQPREIVLKGFWMGRWEVTAGEFADYLNATDGIQVPGQEFVLRGEKWMPRVGRGRYPVSGVSREEAEHYCAWLGERFGVPVRLPSENEWEYAARGQIHGGRYPWGWGEPKGKACFDGAGPKKVGSYRPNPYGLYDMAGNVFEWCASGEGAEQDVARGGSWAERSADCLRVFQRAYFEPGYADEDVGFRVVVEGDRNLNLDEK